MLQDRLPLDMLACRRHHVSLPFSQNVLLLGKIVQINKAFVEFHSLSNYARVNCAVDLEYRDRIHHKVAAMNYTLYQLRRTIINLTRPQLIIWAGALG